jgi:hypothetical protein
MEILRQHDGSINLIDDFDFGTCEDHCEFEPSREDLEWIACVNVDSFIPANLDFVAWLDEQGRQHHIRGGESPEYSYGGWHDWLGGQIDRLAQLVRWTGATSPSEHEERMEVYERELRERCYADGYAAAKGANDAD